MPPRVFIIDQGLLYPIGHHPSINRALNKEIARRGMSPIHIVNQACRGDVLHGMEAARLFRHYCHEELSSDPRHGLVQSFFLHAEALQQDLGALKAGTFSADDTIILMVNTPAVLMGYLEWWRALDPAVRPRTVALLAMYGGITSLDPPTLDVSVYFQTMAKLYRFVGEQIAGDDLEGFVLLTGNRTMVEDYAYLLHKPVREHSLHLTFDPASIDPIAEAFERSDAPPTVGYFGHGRDGRGFAILPDIVERLLAGHPTVRIHIQADRTLPNDPMRPVMDRVVEMAQREPRLTFTGEYLPVDAFYAAIAEIDVMLLPYYVLTYARIPSGVFTETTAMGRASVVPAGTSMAEDIATLDGFGAIAAQSDAETFAQATLALLARSAELRATAPAVRDRWRQHHGTEHLVDQVLDAVGRPRSLAVS